MDRSWNRHPLFCQYIYIKFELMGEDLLFLLKTTEE